MMLIPSFLTSRCQKTWSWRPLWAAGRLALWGLGVLVVVPPLTAQPPTLDQVRRAIQTQHEKIVSLEVETEIDGEEIVSRNELFKWLFKMGVRRGREHFALKGEKRFVDETRVVAAALLTDFPRATVDQNAPAWVQQRQRELQQEYDEMKSSSESLSQESSSEPVEVREIRAFNGEEYRTKDNEWHGSITPKERMVQQHQFDFLYLRCIGMHAADPTVLDADRQNLIKGGYLPEALERFAYEVSTEELNGISCIRLDGRAGVDGPQQHWTDDRIWLDPQKGYMVVRRESRDVDSGILKFRTINSAPKRFSKGVWLPMKCVMEEFAPSYAPESLRDRPLVATHLNVARCEVNKVDEDIFDVQLRPGAVVWDFGLGPDPMQPVERLVPANVELPERAHRRWRRYWIVGNTLVLAVLIFVIWRRARAD